MQPTVQINKSQGNKKKKIKGTIVSRRGHQNVRAGGV